MTVLRDQDGYSYELNRSKGFDATVAVVLEGLQVFFDKVIEHRKHVAQMIAGLCVEGGLVVQERLYCSHA